MLRRTLSRRLLLVAAIAALSDLPASPFRAQARCEVALLLADDISGSVDDGEYRLQVDGLADALADPDVRTALLQGNSALAVVQWSATGMQKLVIPWRQMRTADDIAAFADLARAQPRAFGMAQTAVADALSFSADQFATAPDCRHRVIDISGDGVQNEGGSLAAARAKAEGAGITVNAIAIEGLGLAITEFYRRLVITENGFVVTARGHVEYPRAIREKLLRELVIPTG
ncbi:MAG: DUF1194 domain-containing protein [Proteobacteria bacterium]|nr:DUF1194 domain-containing protein [Pseudomonadota bacterium]MBS0572696.1 DUF1194 domain-containing protein [Pseudomonadota bacterium]